MITWIVLGGIITVIAAVVVAGVSVWAVFGAAVLGCRLRARLAGRREAARISACVESLTPEQAAEILAPRDGSRP